MTEPRITLVAAYSTNRVIGDGQRIPWHSVEDLRHFKSLTWGRTLVMGRKTFESIGHALPGRDTRVMTRNGHWRAEGVSTAQSLTQALRGAQGHVYVVGGAEIYAEAMPLAYRQVLTEVGIEVPGDTYYPTFDESEWQEKTRIHLPTIDPPLTWRYLIRK